MKLSGKINKKDSLEENSNQIKKWMGTNKMTKKTHFMIKNKDSGYRTIIGIELDITNHALLPAKLPA